MGAAAIRHLRQLIQDKFGRSTLPHLRWLLADTDANAIESAQSGPPELALSPEDVLLTRLQRPTHYLSRDGLPAIDSWLAHEELFRMPRTPATDGIRGLGRLALCDQYHLICHRIRTALERFRSAMHVEEADRLTNLGIRSTFPRVYVLSSLWGGTGSGMLLDLTYLIRRELRRLGFGTPHAIGLFGLPGAGDERSNARTFANARAALVELMHFGPQSHYSAVFDSREGPLTDPERAFRRCSLIQQANQSDPSAFDKAAATLAHIAFAEMFGPLGKSVYPDSAAPPENLLATIGIRRVVWPRSQVLRESAWRLCRRTLADWVGKGSDSTCSTARDFVAAKLSERMPDRTLLRTLLESHLPTALGSSPHEKIDASLAGINVDSNPDSTPMMRARVALRELHELLGRPSREDGEAAFVVGSILSARVRQLGTEADAKLGRLFLSLIEQPGLRLAGAEEAIHAVRARITDELRLADREAANIEEQAKALYLPIHYQLVAPGTDASYRGGYWSSGAEAIAALRQWAKVRLQSLIAGACASVYRVLLGNLPEHVRELSLIRTQLDGFLKKLNELAPTSATSDGVSFPVFPNEARSIADAAERLLRSIKQDDFKEFESLLQARIQDSGASIVEVCNRPKDLARRLVVTMREQAYQFLDKRVLKPDAFQVVFQETADPADLQSLVERWLKAAVPQMAGDLHATVTALAVPESAEAIGRIVRDACRDEIVTICPGGDDIVIWRECRGLTLKSFPQLSGSQIPVASEDGIAPRTSHARTDIAWNDRG